MLSISTNSVRSFTWGSSGATQYLGMGRKDVYDSAKSGARE